MDSVYLKLFTDRVKLNTMLSMNDVENFFDSLLQNWNRTERPTSPGSIRSDRVRSDSAEYFLPVGIQTGRDNFFSDRPVQKFFPFHGFSVNFCKNLEQKYFVLHNRQVSLISMTADKENCSILFISSQN